MKNFVSSFLVLIFSNYIVRSDDPLEKKITDKFFINSDNIFLIFSPELHSQFIVTPDSTEDKSDERVTEGSLENLQDRPIKEEKVIKVDFSRKKKSH